ncbi:hypothetical protein Taro_045509 [Colocasia esculenta]|uniref:Exopolygalacturonase n=1 Tax=Colocasia esculenta TaxID=4460 RepID=A0A843X6L5_COLES|nr:hypothetical protein [Colocasia esculenta]
MANFWCFLSLFLALFFTHPFTSAADTAYNILSFGAKSDGQTDSTKALLGAWSAACGSPAPATLYVPSGRFYITHAAMNGPCKSNKVTIQIDGTLVAPSSYSNDVGKWIIFDHVEGVSVIGGTIDGRGAPLWECKARGHSCPDGATSLSFSNSKHIVVSGLTSVNSELYHIDIDGCQNVLLQGVKVSAPGDSPNTDGIHVQGSTDVTIMGAGISTGDDCVSVGPGTTNLWIERVTCGPGHGISIGSLGKEYQEQGVVNVTVKTAVFTGTENGLRIKTWGRPSDGFVKGVVFEHVMMQNVNNPIIITQNYCPGEKNCPGQNSGVKISQVTYSDIHGSSATPIAVDFSCSPTSPCSGIGLQDIKLTYGNKAAEASCKNAGGSASGFVVPPTADTAYNILSFGAKADGQTDSTKALLGAWSAACGSPAPATLYVPSGRFYITHAAMNGPCKSNKVTIQIDGTLVAPSSYSNDVGKWIIFDHVEGVSVIGGTIDGQGAPLWECKARGHSCPDGATSLSFSNSKHIVVSGLTSVNSELYHIDIDGCQNVLVQGVKVSAPGNSPNTDGIHVQGSTDVTIMGAGIGTGDDCVSVGPGTTNLWIERVTCGPGHGISIGSLGKEYQEQGVVNVTVKTAVFTGTENGLRIKTWGRASDGFVKGVIFEHVMMQNVNNPIIITQNYCPGEKNCPGQNSGIKISQVTYSDIHGSSATPIAVDFSCSPTNPCTGIGLQDIKLTYGNKVAEASCKNAGGIASGFVVPPSCL